MSFVAEVDNQFVGFVMAYLTYVREQVSEACIIQIFGVDPKYQRQGIATKLVQALLDKCRSKKSSLSEPWSRSVIVNCKVSSSAWGLIAAAI
jgi:predicted N-acetyltransferase YhbS